MLQKNIHAPRNSRVHCFPRAFSQSYLFLLVLSFLFCICSVSQFICHFVLMFTNPCESAQKFRNFLLLNLFCYTYRLFKAPRSLCSKIEKARTRKWEETGERKGGVTASALSFFPSPALIFSCVFHLRVIPTI